MEVGHLPQVVAQQVVAHCGHYGFRVELDALYRQGFVADAHNQPVVGPGGYFQAVGQGFGVDDQAVVADGLKGVGQAGEYALAVVVDRGGFAVPDFAGPVHGGAVGVADALVAQADAQHRQPRPEMADDVVGDARLPGRAGAGRDDDAGRRHFRNFRQRNPVVADDADFGAQFAEVLVQVPGKAVVVVNEQQHQYSSTSSSQLPSGSWQ